MCIGTVVSASRESTGLLIGVWKLETRFCFDSLLDNNSINMSSRIFPVVVVAVSALGYNHLFNIIEEQEKEIDRLARDQIRYKNIITLYKLEQYTNRTKPDGIIDERPIFSKRQWREKL
jgi:hypothetical protein